MAKGLSKAQSEVLEGIKRDIAKARTVNSYDEYWEKYESGANYLKYRGIYTVEDYKARYPEDYKRWSNRWRREYEGKALTHCNSRTLRKLEDLGYIEIIEDSTGEYFGIDVVRLIED